MKNAGIMDKDYLPQKPNMWYMCKVVVSSVQNILINFDSWHSQFLYFVESRETVVHMLWNFPLLLPVVFRDILKYYLGYWEQHLYVVDYYNTWDEVNPF